MQVRLPVRFRKVYAGVSKPPSTSWAESEPVPNTIFCLRSEARLTGLRSPSRQIQMMNSHDFLFRPRGGCAPITPLYARGQSNVNAFRQFQLHNSLPPLCLAIQSASIRGDRRALVRNLVVWYLSTSTARRHSAMPIRWILESTTCRFVQGRLNATATMQYISKLDPGKRFDLPSS
jgi:hypothetical protein